MICYVKNEEEVRGIDDLSSRTELINNQLGRKILAKHGYQCVKPLNFDNRFKDLFEFNTDYGIDEVIFTQDMPEGDPLNLKKVDPFKDGIYYSIDYKSNNFKNNLNDEIQIKLMKFRSKFKYKEGSYFKFLDKGIAGRIYKLNSFLDKEKQTDLLMYVKQSDKQPNPTNCLINAYIIPIKPLKRLVIDNLNKIRKECDKPRLELNKSHLDLFYGLYETWNLYDENKCRNYNFKLIKQPDQNYGNKPDLMMKINRKYIPNYILFDNNGEIKKMKM